MTHLSILYEHNCWLDEGHVQSNQRVHKCIVQWTHFEFIEPKLFESFFFFFFFFLLTFSPVVELNGPFDEHNGQKENDYEQTQIEIVPKNVHIEVELRQRFIFLWSDMCFLGFEEMNIQTGKILQRLDWVETNEKRILNPVKSQSAHLESHQSLQTSKWTEQETND